MSGSARGVRALLASASDSLGIPSERSQAWGWGAIRAAPAELLREATWATPQSSAGIIEGRATLCLSSPKKELDNRRFKR